MTTQKYKSMHKLCLHKNYLFAMEFRLHHNLAIQGKKFIIVLFKNFTVTLQILL